MDIELVARIRRIHAAVGGIEEFDLSKFKAVGFAKQGLKMFAADFRGDRADEELANAVHSAIYNVAHFKDHLRSWAKAKRRDISLIDEAVKQSRDLQIVFDLADADKHGGQRRKGGQSGLNPRIVNLDRALQLRTRAAAGSMVGLTFSSDGTPVLRGDGTGCVVITGSVVDQGGNTIGDLRDILVEAVAAWENLLKTFGAPDERAV